MLAALGYFLAALSLQINFARTIILLVVTAVAYALIVRWVTIGERKMRRAQRLEERRRINEESAETSAAGFEEGGVPELEEADLDLDEVGDQMRHLLRFLCGVGFWLGLLFVW